MLRHNFDAAPNRTFPELSYSRFKCSLAITAETFTACDVSHARTRLLGALHALRSIRHQYVLASPARGCGDDAGDRSTRFAQRRPTVDLQLSGQARLRPCSRSRACAVPRTKLQGA